MRKPRNSKKFELMNDEQRLEYMATANRVTIGVIWQVFDNELKRFYVAKVRGIIVSDGDTYKFEDANDAAFFGRRILNGWQQEYYNAHCIPAELE